VQERSGSGTDSSGIHRARSPRTPILSTPPLSPSRSPSPLPHSHRRSSDTIPFDGHTRRLRRLEDVQARLPDLTSKTLARYEHEY
jgi:hypothetical protein